MQVNLFVAIPTFVATLAWGTFIVSYWLRATWWKHPVGRNTMAVSAVLFLITLRGSAIHIWYATHPEMGYESPSVLFTVAGGVFYAMLAWLGVRRTILMESAQRGGE